MRKYCGVVKLVVILMMFSLFAMIATENTLAAESSDQGSETFEDGFSFKNGILTIKKIYYTVVDVAGKSKCVYQTPWIKYKNADEIKHIVIDADMVYTDKNITTGKAFKDLSSTRGDFLGGGPLFGNMDSLKTLTIKRLSMGRITDISYMFSNNKNLKKVDISGLKMRKVKDISFLFSGCSKLKKINLNGLRTWRLEKAESVFEKCTSLRSIGISGWNTSNIKNFRHFFYQCSSLKTLDLTGWKIKDADVAGMFYGCDSLADLKLNDVKLGNTIEVNPMFDEHNSLPSYVFAKDWKIENVQPIAEDVYSFVLIPIIGDPDIVFIEYIYYTKEMPDWYKDYVEEIQAVDDCLSCRTPLIDFYIKTDSGYAGGELTPDDLCGTYKDVIMGAVDSYMETASDEEKEVIEKIIGVYDETENAWGWIQFIAKH